MDSTNGFLIYDKNFMFNSITLDGILAGEENHKPGYFPYSVLQNVPYIEYPGLTKNENSAVFSLARECLARSKRLYHYNEVSATYRSDMSFDDEKAFVFTHGNEVFTSYLNNKEVAEFLGQSSELIFITMHNHPNNSSLSLEDLAIFCSQINIKYLGAVGHDGRLSFAIRRGQENYSDILVEGIMKYASDSVGIIKNSDESIFSHLKTEEKALIKSFVVEKLKDAGAIVLSNVGIGDIADLNADFERMGEHDDYE